MKLLKNSILLRFGASCEQLGRLGCFLPSQYHFWAFLLHRNSKKQNRTTKYTPEMTKNAAGAQKKRLKPGKLHQDGKKNLQENKKMQQDKIKSCLF
jgi:hypothetical protein